MSQIKQLIDDYGSSLKKKLRDPIFFIENVLYEPKGWKLTPYSKEWVNLCYKHRRINITAFRSSGKTEVVLINQALHRAFSQKKWDGIIVSYTLSQSTEVLKRIRNVVLENEVLRDALASGRFDEQNKTTITFKNKSRIRCLPYTDKIRMNHVNWIGMDEIGLYKDHSLMKSAVTPAVTAKKGIIHCIGTPMSKIDLIHALRDNNAYINRIYPAWTSKVNLFKQRYPKRSVVKKDGKYQILLEDGSIFEEYDSVTWSREFLCVPLGEEDKLFPFELMEHSFDYDLKISRIPTNKDNDKYDFFIGVDFALSAESSADFTVIVVLARDKKTMKLYLNNIFRWKGLSYGTQRARLAEILLTYKPIKAVLDESSFGASFVDDMRRECIGVPIEGFKFTRGLYTNRKQELITMLRTTFESNWEHFSDEEKIPLPKDKLNFIIPRNNSCTRTMKVTNEMLNEVQAFGMKYDREKHTVKFEGVGEHDDIVIALALANYACHGNYGLKPVVRRGSTGYRKAIFGKTH